MKRKLSDWARIIGWSTIVLAVVLLVGYGFMSVVWDIFKAIVHCIKTC